ADDGFGVGRSLAAAWGAVGLAVVGGAALLVAAHRLGERRGRFVSAVTHELRTPLTTFRLYADLLADARDGDSGRRADYVATLQTEAARLARVVEGVLLYARLEEGAARARRERVDAAELVERALAPSTRRAAEAGFELEVDVESMRGVVVDADPQAVEQILLNLVDNACKYAAAAPSRRIMIDGVAEARAVRIRVADEGPGVPAGQESAIFRPFRRAATHAVEATPGAGLGLALARGLARAGGGALRLLPRRAEGGACFELALPRAGAERR
ncbi:MAG TPA: HAMP domain-containing sensor histidine kinase, partial [Planctomycetota bacterium]|nr:HAMP domain-containing sensor histidine kinase [Planctomycetota bacterium]